VQNARRDGWLDEATVTWGCLPVPETSHDPHRNQEKTLTKLTTPLSLIAAAAFVLVAQGAYAQSASAPTRAEVKAEAKAAKKDGTAPKVEEGSGMTQPGKSVKPRAEVKAETKKAEKDGTIPKAEEGSGKTQPGKSVKPRAEVKAETTKAEKAGTIPKAGEKAGEK
jgi:hypothetical protein